MDMLKMIQFLTLLLHFLISLSVLSLNFLSESSDLYSIKFLLSFDGNLTVFILTNQMYWLSLTVHIKNFEKLRQDHSYAEIRKRNRRFEWWFLIWVGILYAISVIGMTWMLVGQFVFGWRFFQSEDEGTGEDKGFWGISDVFQAVFYYSKSPMFIFFLMTYWVLFFYLCKTMRENLSYYYKNQRRHLFLLFLSSILFILTNIILGFMDYASNLTLNSLSYYNEEFGHKSATVFIFVFILAIIQQMWYFFYIFDSINNINFKQYLWDVMKGYNIKQHYPNSSIFLRKSSFWRKSNNNPEPDDESSFYLTTASERESTRSLYIPRLSGTEEEESEDYIDYTTLSNLHTSQSLIQHQFTS